jgi:hypothetical protein
MLETLLYKLPRMYPDMQWPSEPNCSFDHDIGDEDVDHLVLYC